VICNLGVVGSNPTRGSRKSETEVSLLFFIGEIHGKRRTFQLRIVQKVIAAC
jgi:hypothetical protein